MSLLILLAILLMSGVLLWAGMILLMARGVLRPARMTDAKALYVLKRLSPGDLALEFEDVVFHVRDDVSGKTLRMPAWWIPHPAGGDKTCVIVHGYGDAKVGGIAWAPLLRGLGFHVLAVDLRAHGEADGAITTAGYLERHDLSQIIDQLRGSRPAATRRVACFGVSLGAAVVAATAALRDDLDAVVLESPYAHFVSAAATHGRLMGMPLVTWQQTVVRLAGRLARADFDEVAPVRLIPRIGCPVMLIHSADDPFVVGEDSRALVDAMNARSEAQGPTVFWEAPGAFHVLGLQADEALYGEKLRAFFDTALARGSEGTPAAPAELGRP